MFAGLLLCITLLMVVSYGFSDEEDKKAKHIGIISLVLCLFLVSIMATESFVEIGSADKIFDFSDASLYHNEKNDEYFAIKNNIYNPLNPFDRIEIDQTYANDLVKKVVDAETQLDSLKNLQIISENE